MTTPDKERGKAPGQVPEDFTDRERHLEEFRRVLAAPEEESLRVLAFHGVGGRGKTRLLDKLADELDRLQPPMPHARFDVANLKSPATAVREVLLRLRSDLESRFRLTFPRFDLLLSVLLAAEGGPPPPLVALNPSLKSTFDFTMGLLGVPSDMITKFLHSQVRKSKTAERFLAKAGGREEILHLRDRARRDDPTLADELIARFADELVKGLPPRVGKACRGVLFFDTFETLWKGSDAGRSVQARQLDAWLRQLARTVREQGVLVVVAGSDELRWAEDDADWKGAIETHLLGGFSRHDAQIYLARRKIGPQPWTPETPLQSAILDTCAEAPGPDGEESYLPFYLSLCADIVDNNRDKNNGADPPPNIFIGIPNDQVAQKLADRFLKSLPSEQWELWVRELSLTPSFDERAALDLDRERQHNLGRAGWKQLCRYSFLEPQPESHFRLHKTMRDVLRTSLGDEVAAVHTWFSDHWKARDESALAFFHHWSLNPEVTLNDWRSRHEDALRDHRIAAARALLDDWSEIPLDGLDRQRLGNPLWARTHFELGRALWDTPIAPRAPSLNAAIAHYEAALRVATEANFPSVWALTQNRLGTAYGDLPTGDRGENLRRAIACFEAALRVYTEADFPSDWAMMQGNLGTSYGSLPTGNRDENLRRAIACFEAALRVHTEADFPSDWAMTQNNLGTAYSALPTGDRNENLCRAIAYFETALRVHTEAEIPSAWAMTQNNLGTAYGQLPTGNRDENLRRAIACFEAALRVYSETDFPSDWAATQHKLGTAYSDLPTGDRDENLRRAIAYYEAALRVHTEADFPSAWAATQNNLGNAYGQLPTGNRDENLRRAVACFEAALRVHTEADFPSDWAMIQDNLGNAYGNLPTGNRYANLRRAIAYYEAALRVYTEADFPLAWAATQNNLGTVYGNLPTGNRGENLRRAIAYFEASLRVRPEADFPSAWAATQHKLGTAYSELSTGDRDENLRRAIAYYEAALRVHTEADFPSAWAGTQNNLGIAYGNLPTGDRDENLRRAIAYYETALRVRTEADFPSDWALTQNNLGTAYGNLPTGNRDENLRRAVACFEAALRVHTETDFPSDWAAILFNLGLTLREEGRLDQSVQTFECAARGLEAIGARNDAEKARMEAEKSRRKKVP
jgi:tetratricopeptide (TPR) repeat protein